MTNKEAIKILQDWIDIGFEYESGYGLEGLSDKEEEACKIAIKAIEALESPSKRMGFIARGMAEEFKAITMFADTLKDEDDDQELHHEVLPELRSEDGGEEKQMKVKEIIDILENKNVDVVLKEKTKEKDEFICQTQANKKGIEPYMDREVVSIDFYILFEQSRTLQLTIQEVENE